jgi:hypothetical protein
MATLTRVDDTVVVNLDAIDYIIANDKDSSVILFSNNQRVVVEVPYETLLTELDIA